MSRDAALAAALRALLPPRATAEPPPWLRPEQHESFARALAALELHGAALVADPVGSGKTYIALAAARVLNRRAATVCIVPATLHDQWAGTAARLCVPVALHTHERASRGRLPPARSAVVLIDESHRFRVPTTGRYAALAPWLVGSAVLMLTATPVVNRPADLLHQLLLGARDDALAAFGVDSLAALLEAGRGHPALERLVIIGRSPAAGRPQRAARTVAPCPDPALVRHARALDALRLSAAPEIAALVRTGLLRALASSPAAFRAALVRYRGLLRHASDAAAAGRPLTRRVLRAAVGADESQLVLWVLFDEQPDAPVELDPEDLPLLDDLIARIGGADPKASRLEELLADGRRTIVFVTHRATVPHLRDVLMPRLGPQRVGWCTGAAAGVGRVRVPRGRVLAMFDPARAARAGPDVTVLVTTDVAAEGLDLQRAERIVHYDLPWTPMRLRQREGRALRIGSPHASVDVVRLRPPRCIERRLGITRTLATKAMWPARLGLSAAAERARAAPPHPAVPAPAAGLIVVARRGPDALVLLQSGEGVESDPLAVGARIAALRADATALEVVHCGGTAAASHRLVTAATSALRRHLTRAAGGTGTDRAVSAGLVRRLTELGTRAVRRRDGGAIERVEQALAFVRRGHTAGEAMLLTALAEAPGRELLRRLPPASARAEPEPGWEVVLVISFPACGPSSSISTAPSSIRSS